LVLLFFFGSAQAAPRADLPKEVTDKIDALVASAYKAASAKLPCKISTSSTSRMLRWQDVDKCMARAITLVDWEGLSKQLEALRPANVSVGDFAAAVEKSFNRQALPYNKVFQVRNQKALLPLTNPILKYLPTDSLQDQPVFDQRGSQVGTFAGVFAYEGMGLTAPYRLTMFQYADLQGKIQVPSDRLLLDSYGVPWIKIMTQPGFRLTTENLPGLGKK